MSVCVHLPGVNIQARADGRAKPMTELGRREDPASRRVIDLAIGILMGLRGCSEQEAFDDLVAAVHDTGIGPGALARALVGLAGGSDASLPHCCEVIHRWGHLLAHRMTSAASPAD
jgi:hypothetical protein